VNSDFFAVPPYENEALQEEVRERLDRLTKPPGSLGRLEELALRFCLCRGMPAPELSCMEIFTFAGDHGITEEKITPYPSEVTRQMVLNMVQGGAAVTVMCRKAGIQCVVVDMGVVGTFQDVPGLLIRKVGEGTRNFLREPAMSAEDCERATEIGMELAGRSNADLIGIGEMGIGNTSSASALYSIILDADPEETVGPGTGSSGPQLERKREMVRRAVSFHKKAWNGSSFDALRRVGGFEIAGMAGMIFGASRRRIPVVVDGFVAGAAALVAMRIQPSVRPYIFFSHASGERYHGTFLAREGIRPILSLDMRLGEGTGSVLAMQIMAQAMECYHRMATFESAGVSSSHAS